jgi:hypothetical protein
MSNSKSSQIIENLLDELDGKDRIIESLKAFLDRVVSGWKSGSMTPDQVRVLENGDMRIVNREQREPTSLAVCDEEVTKAVGTNGKEAANGETPLAEGPAEGQPEETGSLTPA